MAEDNLDALCDLLNDSDDDDIFNLVEEQVANIQNDEPKPTENGEKKNVAEMDSDDDDIFNLVEEQVANIQNEEPKPTENGEDKNVAEMEAKMRKMQEEMAKMQKELETAKKSQTKKLSEIDVFQPSGSRSVNEAPRCPTKTNPFAEQDRPKNPAKYHPETPAFGPALSKKTSRVITGDEKLRFEHELKKRAEERDMAVIAARDLADSSDDEEDPTAEKYNSFGKDIKRMSRVSSSSVPSTSTSKPAPKLGWNAIQGSEVNLSNPSSVKKLPDNMMIEKHTKIRIANPTVTQVQLDLSLLGRKLIPLSKLRQAIVLKETNCDWTTIGVIYYKATQKSKNGNTFTVWKMTDLLGDIITVSVLLFGKANTKHYSMPINKVVGLLNPKILEDRTGKGELSISVDHPDKIMEMGDSIDVKKCQAKKADGSNCTNLVNANACEYCAFHVKKAYKAVSSKRAELQSAFSGDARSRIMNKIAPKGEIFGGGQVLNKGLPGKTLAKNTRKDQAILSSLGVKPQMRPSQPVVKKSSNIDLFKDNGKLAFKSHLKDHEKDAVNKLVSKNEELGRKLLAPTPGSRLLMKHLTRDTKAEEDKNKTKDQLEAEKRAQILQNQLNAKKLLQETKKDLQVPRPTLGKGMKSGFIDLDFSKPSKPTNKKEAAILALKGQKIAKNEPNYVMKRKRSIETTEQTNEKVTKVLNKSTEEDDENIDIQPENKKPKVIRSFTGEIIDEKKMEQLKNSKSLNQNLVHDAELEAEEKYFDHLEKKEAMEEKMINTKEIDAKVVTCHICNYTAYKQSELCKQSNHLIKVTKAKKRFFECKNCKKRTQSFDRLPKYSCSNCKGFSWIRTGMMREKKGPTLENEQLVIRGHEESHIGAVHSKSLNINL